MQDRKFTGQIRKFHVPQVYCTSASNCGKNNVEAPALSVMPSIAT